MAEIALGGTFVAAGTRRGRQSTKECTHTETLSAITAGLERIVCETCGHLSFRPVTTLSGPVERERFARPVDRFQPAAEVSTPPGSFEVFANTERLHIRSRYESHPQGV